jgi:hypothetical protein
MIKITISLFFVFFASLNSASGQELSIVEKSAVCAGYHRVWFILRNQANNSNDANFSSRIADQLDSRFGKDPIYSSAQSRAIQLVTNAFLSQNFDLVKSFAGICHEIGQPIGQNTR